MNQKVYVKQHNPRAAGFDFRGRSANLTQNYRNTRQVLRAAYRLPEAFPPAADDPLEVAHPDLSMYEGGRPVVLNVSPTEQPDRIMDIVRARRQYRVAVVSENDSLLQSVRACAIKQGLVVYDLLRNEDIDKWRDQTGNPISAPLAVARMEAVKGFEFDTVIAGDLSGGIVPQPGVPEDEYWRSAAVVYTALTRARDELVITFTGEPSKFLDVMKRELDFVSRIDDVLIRQIVQIVT